MGENEDRDPGPLLAACVCGVVQPAVALMQASLDRVLAEHLPGVPARATVAIETPMGTLVMREGGGLTLQERAGLAAQFIADARGEEARPPHEAVPVIGQIIRLLWPAVGPVVLYVEGKEEPDGEGFAFLGYDGRPEWTPMVAARCARGLVALENRGGASGQEVVMVNAKTERASALDLLAQARIRPLTDAEVRTLANRIPGATTSAERSQSPQSGGFDA